MEKKEKVFLGMSGGVDSSASAAILQAKGYDVHGVFIRVWHPEILPCTEEQDIKDAQAVAKHLGITFETIDLAEQYKKEVVDYMIESYRKGETPNPDVMCNKFVKFGAFFEYALHNGADRIATGHYAQVDEVEGQYRLLRSADEEKDQTYFLWTLTQGQLRRTLFPVGHLTKGEVRSVAAEKELSTAHKKDSQGVCFLGALDMKKFLSEFIQPKEGQVFNEEGVVIGHHDGAHFFTLGQRHGFTITAKTPTDAPYYVVRKDIGRNRITVSHEHSGADAKTVYTIQAVHWIRQRPDEGKSYLCRYRHRQTFREVLIGKFDGETAEVRFKEPELIAAGQSVVLYDDKECIGGGIVS